MRYLLFTVLLLVTVAAKAQTSSHGFSLDIGVKNMNDFNISQPDPAVADIFITDDPAISASLRYYHFFGERISLYAGFGFTATNSFILFRQAPMGDGRTRFGGGPGVDQFVSHLEFGASYAYPITYRLSLVAEGGGQLINVRRGGGMGSSRVTNGANELLLETTYSFTENTDEAVDFAIQLSPGVRYQVGDHFYLTLRGDFILSGAKLLEDGQVQVRSMVLPEPSSGTFERPYASKGLDLMLTYRF